MKLLANDRHIVNPLMLFYNICRIANKPKLPYAMLATAFYRS